MGRETPAKIEKSATLLPSAHRKKLKTMIELLDIKREVETLCDRLGKTQDYL